MIRHSVDLEVSRPVDVVFAWLTDADNYPRWDSSSLKMEPLEPGPWHEGTTFREVRRIGPWNSEVRSRVVLHTPPIALDMESDDLLRVRNSWRLEDRGSATLVRWSCEMEVPSVGRLVEQGIAKRFKQGAEENLDRMKVLIEEDSPA
jgi:hypothetical protein